jgi:HAD superfamily hydrolase (TIGR01509 family)
MIRAIVFDCFGVVISDALEVLTGRLRETDPEAARRVSDLVRQSNQGLADPTESSRQVAAVLGLTYEEYRAQIAAGEIKNTELIAYIRELRQSYKTALLSNIGAGSLKRRFTDAELTELFDVVVASGDIGFTKPAKEAYLITAERLEVPPAECVFVDDRSPYCEGARGVGMRTVCYQDFTQFRTELESILAAE